MIATSGFLTALKWTKFNFGRGSAPDPAGRAYSAPRPPGWFKGPTSKGRGRKSKGGEKKKGRGKEETEGERKEGRDGKR